VKAASVPPGLITLLAKSTGRAVCGKTARTVPRGRDWKRTGRSDPAPRQPLTRQLKIKRDKSIGGLDQLPNFRPDTIHAWICAKLLAQQIAARIATPAVAFPPSAVGRLALAPVRGVA